MHPAFRTCLEREQGGIPAYLKLLAGKSEKEFEEAIREVEAACAAVADPEKELVYALQGGAWREQLVALAGCVLHPTPGLLPVLWRAWEQMGQVAPQIATVLSFVDEAFEANAGARIAKAIQDPAIKRLAYAVAPLGALAQIDVTPDLQLDVARRAFQAEAAQWVRTTVSWRHAFAAAFEKVTGHAPRPI